MIEWTDEDRKCGYHLNGDSNTKKEDYIRLEDYCQRRFGDMWMFGRFIGENNKIYKYKIIPPMIFKSMN